MEKIEIVKYNPIWKEIYKKEAKKIEIALEDNLTEIHHFGSTSVEDLYAKPKIDILAIVNDIEKINTVSLEKIGFKNRGEVIKTGRYFSKKEPKVHLHIFEKGNFNIERNLRFRNILRKNEKIRKEYQDLKINLAKKYKDGIDYVKNKTDFIEKVLRDEK